MARNEHIARSPRRVLDRGKEFLDAGDLDEARRCFEEAASGWPMLAEPYVQLGQIYFDQREFVAARVLFERALSLLEREAGEAPPPGAAAPLAARPGPVRERVAGAGHGGVDGRPVDSVPLALRALNGIALCAYWQGAYRDALRWSLATLDRDASDPLGVRYLLGELYHRLGDLERAIEAYAAAPDDPHGAFNHALALYTTGSLEASVRQTLIAFLWNRYIPAFLLDDDPSLLQQVEPWQQDSTQWPDLALQYVELCSDLWQETPGALTFLRTVWSHPEAKDLVARHAALAQTLGRETDLRHRKRLQARLAELQSVQGLEQLAARIAGRLRV